jgi:HYDIN/CFA65/VesB-like, Ig-like domain
VNQKIAPSGLSADGARWKLLGTIIVNSGQLVAKLANSANGLVTADAIRIERVIPVSAPLAEIGIATGGYEMVSGSSVIAFGPRDLGAPQTHTFTVTNSGTASLTLTSVDPASLPAGFSLAQNLGTTFLTPGEATTFAVRLNADVAGSFGGWIAIANSDSNENPFRFQVAGTVVDPSVPQIIDDGAAGNKLVGGWTHVTTRGHDGDLYTASAGNGSVYSTWTFSGLPTGSYRVQATWRIATNNATNAPYTLYNGSQAVGTAKVNQQLTPSGLWDGTTHWQNLGTVAVSGGQLMVKLTNAANGTVVADAIRIERIFTSSAALPDGVTSTYSVQPASDQNADAWLSTALASAGQNVPDSPALAPATSTSSAANSSPALAEALWAGNSGGEFEPEGQLLADVLDLLGQARAASDGDGPLDLIAVQDAALAGLLATQT